MIENQDACWKDVHGNPLREGQLYYDIKRNTVAYIENIKTEDFFARYLWGTININSTEDSRNFRFIEPEDHVEIVRGKIRRLEKEIKWVRKDAPIKVPETSEIVML